jgi:hypothetical protein
MILSKGKATGLPESAAHAEVRYRPMFHKGSFVRQAAKPVERFSRAATTGSWSSGRPHPTGTGEALDFDARRWINEREYRARYDAQEYSTGAGCFYR